MFQSFYLNAVAIDGGCLPYVIDQLGVHIAAGRRINPQSWERALAAVIEEHAAHRHSDEVGWALWATIALGLRLTVSQAGRDMVSEMDSDVVALLALHLNHLHGGTFSTTLWERWMTTDELTGQHWLVAYEANVKGWLPSYGCQDNVAAVPAFAALRDAGVYFYGTPRAGAKVGAARPLAGGRINVFYA